VVLEKLVSQEMQWESVGGGRVCYLYMTVHETIYFLEAYAKSEKENISEQEKKRMKKKVEEIKNVMEKEDDNTVKHN
jgi:hypothetical protein